MSLKGIKLNRENLGRIATLIGQNRPLISLDLSGCFTKDCYADLKSPCGQGDKLAHQHTELVCGSEAAKTVSKALESNTQLQRLDLSNNGIHAKGMLDIASVLKKNVTLQHLKLSDQRKSNSPACDIDAKPFIEVLTRHNGSLLSLDIGLWTAGTDELSKLLMRNAPEQQLALVEQAGNLITEFAEWAGGDFAADAGKIIARHLLVRAPQAVANLFSALDPAVARQLMPYQNSSNSSSNSSNNG